MVNDDNVLRMDVIEIETGCDRVQRILLGRG